MTLMALLLTLAYVAVAALLLNLNLATKLAVGVKACAIVLVTGLYAGVWYGNQALMGWATAAPLPEQFRVHWIMIEDPDKVDRQPGSIYFWVRELDVAGLAVGDPRAHRVAWSEENAEAAQAALAAMDGGELLNGRMSRSALDNTERPEEGVDYLGQSDVGGAGGGEALFEFARVPPPALPPKASPE